MGGLFFALSTLAEDDFDGYPFKAKGTSNRVDDKTLVGDVSRLGLVCANHKGGGAGCHLRDVIKLDGATTVHRRRVVAHHLIEEAV